jgi:hypothetical protein
MKKLKHFAILPLAFTAIPVWAEEAGQKASKASSLTAEQLFF